MTSMLQRKGIALAALTVFAFATFLFGIRIASALSTTLSPGDSGAAVSELQTYLAADSSIYPEGLVTGYYGPLTTSAVQRFQCQYNIVCTGDVTSTGYGRVGPITLGKIQSLQSGVTVEPPPTGDVYGPIMSAHSVATTSTTATISWTTSEPTTNLVMYSTVWPFVFTVAPDVMLPGLTISPSITLTGLLPNTTYYYVPVSTDASGNVQFSFNPSFRTNP